VVLFIAFGPSRCGFTVQSALDDLVTELSGINTALQTMSQVLNGIQQSVHTNEHLHHELHQANKVLKALHISIDPNATDLYTTKAPPVHSWRRGHNRASSESHLSASFIVAIVTFAMIYPC
ncbi:hypothetical protein PMAYCL1PPCAC_11574, partial [Pristionchus mayeri]